MGFTVEDMLLVSRQRYQMKLIAGKGGWSNSISWLLMVEDLTIVQRFSGKELAVTTCLGFQKEEKLHLLMEELVRRQASGLIINTGCYIREVQAGIRKFADDNALPLLTVPWDIEIAEMIKDLSIRIFLQGSTDEQLSTAFIKAIESPEDYEAYVKTLLPHFDIEGSFQVILLHRNGLAEMDTVERKRIGYRLQLALTNLTHNGHFFYYDSSFVVIINALSPDTTAEILRQFRANIVRRIPDQSFVIGVGSALTGIRRLHLSYRRAKAAARMAEVFRTDGERNGFMLTQFDTMGIWRLLSMVSDRQLLAEFEEEYLKPLEDYDAAHDSEYVRTLEYYLKYNGSIRQVADAMFIHRNTISYRMNHIREILGSPLDTEEERLCCLTACLIRHMRQTAP